MTEELRRVLAETATSADAGDPDVGVTTIADQVGEWWRAGRRRRRQRHAAIGAAALVPLALLVAAVAVTRSASKVETLPAAEDAAATTVLEPVPGTRSALELTINPPGAPLPVVEPNTVMGGDVVKLSVQDPPGRSYLRTPLTILQRRVGDEWVTVERTLTYTPDQQASSGQCGQLERVTGGGVSGHPPWVPSTDLEDGIRTLMDFGSICVARDFSIRSAIAELYVWTRGLVTGDYRLCRDVAPVIGDLAGGSDGMVDPSGAVRICAPLRVTGPEPARVFRVDGPCPFAGDGTMPPRPADPMAPQPNGVAYREPGGEPDAPPTFLWKSSATNLQARRPGAAIALFDLRCNIVAYLVSGLSPVPADQLDEVGRDLAGAQARNGLSTRFEAFVPAGDGPPPTTPPEMAGAGDPIGTLRVPRLGYSVELAEGTDHFRNQGRPGHVSTTPRPGGEGNAVLAGTGGGFTRTTANLLREVRVGDLIELSTVEGSVLRYEVVAQADGRPFRFSPPGELSVPDAVPAGTQTITLTDSDLEAGDARFVVVHAARVA